MTGRGAVSAFAQHCEWTGASADDRENWLLARRAGVGGSDVPAIMEVDDFRSELAVYVDKVSSNPPLEEESEVADWGRIFEPLILRRFAQKTGRRVVRGGKLLRSRRASHHLVTLDGVQFSKPPPGCKGPGVVEVKTTGYGDAYAQEDPNDPASALPVRVMLQLQWALYVTGAEWGTVVWLPFPERIMHWVDMAAHRDLQEQAIAPAVDKFWRRVKRRLPPPPDGSESSALALRRLYPGETDEAIVVRGQLARELTDEYQLNKANLELLKNRQGIIRNLFAATLRESKYAILDDGRFWRSAAYREREARCKLCMGVTHTVKPYRTYQPCDPRKKPFHNIVGERALASGSGDDALMKQLAESIVGDALPENEGSEGAAE